MKRRKFLKRIAGTAAGLAVAPVAALQESAPALLPGADTITMDYGEGMVLHWYDSIGFVQSIHVPSSCEGGVASIDVGHISGAARCINRTSKAPAL